MKKKKEKKKGKKKGKPRQGGKASDGTVWMFLSCSLCYYTRLKYSHNFIFFFCGFNYRYKN